MKARKWTYLRIFKVDLRTWGSLSDKAEAMLGKALEGLHALMPDFFNIFASSSSVPCRVLATLALIP